MLLVLLLNLTPCSPLLTSTSTAAAGNFLMVVPSKNTLMKTLVNLQDITYMVLTLSQSSRKKLLLLIIISIGCQILSSNSSLIIKVPRFREKKQNIPPRSMEKETIKLFLKLSSRPSSPRKLLSPRILRMIHSLKAQHLLID